VLLAGDTRANLPEEVMLQTVSTLARLEQGQSVQAWVTQRSSGPIGIDAVRNTFASLQWVSNP
jgi:hypothetical protein